MKRPLLSVLALGLVLLAAPVRATPVVGGIVVNSPMVSFENYLHPVSDDDTPEWAKQPHAKFWYEINLGIQQGGIDGMLLVLRGILFMNQGNVWVMPWVELIPTGSSGDPVSTADAPEPATILLVAAGLAALALRRSRA